MRSRRAFAVAAIAVAAMGGCGDGDGGRDAAPTTTAVAPDGEGDGATVVLKGVKFNPERVSIKTGETVTWQWDDGTVPHDVAGEGFKSEIQEKGTFEHTFNEAGVFEYKCTVHPTMTGTVEVTD